MISIGIHIDSHGFNVVELSLDRGSLKIINSYSHVFPSQNQENQIILFEYLKTLEEKYKNRPVHFCYGLAQSQVSSFPMVFPFKEKFKILKTLPFQIEDKSPFRSDKIFYDGRITKIENNKSYVTCFVTPESHIHDFLKFSKPLKIKPYLLSVEGAALANLINGWNLKNKETSNSLFIYVGFHSSIALVFKEGYLDSLSNIEWGAFPIVEEMAKKYRLSIEQSIHQFFEKSFILTSQKGFTKEQIFFSELIEKKIKLLIHQIKLLKLSFETGHKMSFKKHIVFGPASVIKNFSAYLTTETASSFSRLKSIQDLKSFDLSKPENHNLLISLGLAMEGLKRPPYGGVNFLHSLKKQTFKFFPEEWKSIFLGFVIILFLFSIYAIIRQQESQSLADKIQNVFEDYGNKVASLKRSQVSVDSVQEYLESKKSLQKVEELIQKKVEQDTPIDQLKIITEAIRVEESWQLKVTYLKIKDKDVLIKGLIDKESLPVLKRRLQKISKAKIKELKEVKQEEWKKTEEKLKNLKKADSILEKDEEKEKTNLKENQQILLEKFSYEFVIKEGV